MLIGETDPVWPRTIRPGLEIYILSIYIYMPLTTAPSRNYLPIYVSNTFVPSWGTCVVYIYV